MIQVIKDYQLFMVVGILLAVDLTIMTTWQVADPFYRAIKQMEPYVSTKICKKICLLINIIRLKISVYFSFYYPLS